MYIVAITCPGLMNGTNTEPVPADKASSMGYLESYTYSCLDGYTTDDELCTVCQPNGTLSSPAPMCSRKLLQTTPKKLNVVCWHIFLFRVKDSIKSIFNTNHSVLVKLYLTYSVLCLYQMFGNQNIQCDVLRGLIYEIKVAGSF